MSNIQLISLHIPKTAGTSFYHSLQESYGFSQVARLDIKDNIQKILLNTKEYHSTSLPKEIDVFHGHFSVSSLYSKFPETKDVPIITWLRDPVQRVLSNYYYLQERLNFLVSQHGSHRAILDKMMRSLEEFAVAEINRNKMCKFIGSKPLDEFAFLGILEHYEQELIELSRLIGKRLTSIKVNVTENRQQKNYLAMQVSLIEKHNQEDMELYKEALSIRNKRIKP